MGHYRSEMGYDDPPPRKSLRQIATIDELIEWCETHPFGIHSGKVSWSDLAQVLRIIARVEGKP